MKEIRESDFFDLLVEKIASEVIRRISSPAKRALVLFSGGTIGFNESFESIKKLKADGWQLKVVLSDDAMKILDLDLIKKELNLEIYHSKNIKSQKDLYGCVDLMVIATMSINTAAKLANGITDTVLLSLINHGFMAGVPLIAAKNACNPDDARRAELGMGKSPPGYRQMLLANMDKLVEFGMKLVEAKNLHQASIDIFLSPGKNDQNERSFLPVTGQASHSGEIILDKQVISRTDILKVRDAGIVKVPAGSIVTEYAIDAIDSFGLQIIRI